MFREKFREFSNLTSFSDVIRPDSSSGCLTKEQVPKLSSGITLIDQEVINESQIGCQSDIWLFNIYRLIFLTRLHNLQMVTRNKSSTMTLEEMGTIKDIRKDIERIYLCILQKHNQDKIRRHEKFSLFSSPFCLWWWRFKFISEPDISQFSKTE